MDAQNHTKTYKLERVENGGHGTPQPIDPSIQADLIDKQTTKEAQAFLKECKLNNKWVTCTCKPNALLYVRKTIQYYQLVRLTSRGAHAQDCKISVENMPIYGKKLATRLNSKTLSFHRPKRKKSDVIIKNTAISVAGLQAEASKLSRLMFELYDDAELNTIPLNGERMELKIQYHRIRQAGSQYTIGGHTGNSIIFTHPGSVQKAIDYLNEKQWPANTIPTVLLFMTVDQIDGRNMLMNVKDKSYQLTCQSTIEYFYDNSSPPFNVLMSLAQREDRPSPEVLKASALPIMEKYWLLPIKNKLVRKFIKSLLAMSKDYETGSARIVTPFFPKEFEEIDIRPDFSIERDGISLAVFYFLSTNDESYFARKGEIEFLKSHGVHVYVFDMDIPRNDPERDAWNEARKFFNQYIKNYRVPKIVVPEEQFDAPAEEGLINLLG